MKRKPDGPSQRRLRYEKARGLLLKQLGNKCVRCTQTTLLQFDVITPVKEPHHGISIYDRMRFYVRQHARHNLQLLCPGCHGLKSVQDKFNHRESRGLNNIPISARGTVAFISPVVPSVPSKPTLTQDPGESDWSFECRKHRAALGIP